jgi:predicted ester cyclase
VLVSAAALVSGCSSSTKTGDGSTPPSNRDIVVQFYDALNNHDINLIDRFFAANYRENNKNLSAQGPGLQGDKQLFSAIFTAIPDAHFTVEDVLSEGNLVASRTMITGINKGPLGTHPATNRIVAVTSIDFIRFAGDKFVEHWGGLGNPRPLTSASPSSSATSIPSSSASGALATPSPSAMLGAVLVVHNEASELTATNVSSAPASAAAPSGPATLADDSATLEKLVAAFNNHDEGALRGLVTSDYVEHEMDLADQQRGVAGDQQLFRALWSSYSGIKLSITGRVAQDGEIALRSSATGTSTAAFAGRPPTGNPVALQFFGIFRFVNGKIAEHWGVLPLTSI